MFISCGFEFCRVVFDLFSSVVLLIKRIFFPSGFTIMQVQDLVDFLGIIFSVLTLVFKRKLYIFKRIHILAELKLTL